MEWSQIFTVIGVNIALITAMISIIVWSVNKLDNDIKSIGSRLDGHAMRIDQLYQMFIQLIKDRKK